MRILTITGPVGVGKSRLAAAALEKVSETFTAGTKIIELDVVCPEIGGLNYGKSADVPLEEVESALVDVLPSPVAGAPPTGEGRSLLILDGCEQILPQLREALPPLLAARPGTTVLVTGPTPIGAYGEAVLRLAPLPTPEAGNGEEWTDSRSLPSVRLFLRRVQAIRPIFEFTPENHEAVMLLCQRTDGLPLAIELAAARMKFCSAREVLDGLEEDLGTLSGEHGETLSRHTGVQEAIAWALRQITPQERALLEHLAVFHSKVDVPAAVAISGTGADETEKHLARLVNVSLLDAVEESDGQIVFRLLGLTRQFLLESMRAEGRLDGARRAHAAYFARWALFLCDPATRWNRPRRSQGVYRRQADLLAAMEFLLEEDPLTATDLATTLGLYGHQDMVRVAAVLRDALREGLLPERRAREARSALGRLSVLLGRYEEAEELLTAARREHGASGNVVAMAVDTRWAGVLALQRSSPREAEALLREADAHLSRSGAEDERSGVLRDLAEALIARGEHRAARKTAEASFYMAERVGHKVGAAVAEAVFSTAMLCGGRPEDEQEAEECLESSIRCLAGWNCLPALIPALERVAVLRAWTARGQREPLRQAVLIASAMAARRAETGYASLAPLAGEVERSLDQARSALGERAFMECWSTGQGLDVRTVVAEALTPLHTTDAPAADTGPAQPAGITGTPLTARELQVAELVAQGDTNHRIANRLGISKWTAINHLRNVMRKLEMSSRAEVAGWFEKTRREHGIAAGGRPGHGSRE
ncbi:ATP-binding protein [Nocardiopsis sp. NPDC057823]|uniref:ATP-binding protein n=1 Tax=Nocardiopsis sp. NPDC057823 TaxID=3346256 RepID=UPI00366CFC25